MTAQTTTVRTGEQVTTAVPEEQRGIRTCGAIGVASGLLFARDGRVGARAGPA